MISINDLNEVLLNIFYNFTNKANIKNLLACSRVSPNLYSEAKAIKYFVKASEQNHQEAQELMAFVKKNISKYISLTENTMLYEKQNAFFKSILNK